MDRLARQDFSILAQRWRTLTTFLAMSGAACSTPMTLRME